METQKTFSKAEKRWIVRELQAGRMTIGAPHTDSVLYVNANGPFDSLRMAYVDTVALAKHYDSEMRLTENSIRFWNGYRDALDITGTSNYYETYLQTTGTLTAKKLLIERMFSNAAWEDLATELNNLWSYSTPEDSLETLWFENFMELMIELSEQEGGLLSMDGTQYAQMTAIAESGAHIATKAQAVLYMADDVEFEYPIEKIEEEPLPRKGKFDDEKSDDSILADAESIQFKLYPNPNDGRMILEYEFEQEGGYFIMYDVQGKLITKIELIKGSHKLIIEENNLDSGVYLYKVTDKKSNLQNGRIVVIK